MDKSSRVASQEPHFDFSAARTKMYWRLEHFYPVELL